MPRPAAPRDAALLARVVSAQAVAVPTFASLSDRYGRKPFFMLGASLFVVASALCGAAGDLTFLPIDGMGQLIVFRGLQGIGGGTLMAMSFTAIADLFTPRLEARASRETPVGQAAYLAWAALPDAKAPARLLELTKYGPLSETDEATVFRGIVRDLQLTPDRPADESIALYTDALAAAKSDSAKRAVIAGLGELNDERALGLLTLQQSLARDDDALPRFIHLGDEELEHAPDERRGILDVGRIDLRQRTEGAHAVDIHREPAGIHRGDLPAHRHLGGA